MDNGTREVIRLREARLAGVEAAEKRKARVSRWCHRARLLAALALILAAYWIGYETGYLNGLLH